METVVSDLAGVVAAGLGFLATWLSIRGQSHHGRAQDRCLVLIVRAEVARCHSEDWHADQAPLPPASRPRVHPSNPV